MTKKDKTEERLAALEKLVQSMAGDNKTNTRRVDKVIERLKNIEPHTVEKYLDSARAEALDLHRRFQLVFLKQAVLTEVMWVAGKKYPEYAINLHRAIVEAMEEADEWWKERADNTIAQWIDELSKEFELAA